MRIAAGASHVTLRITDESREASARRHGDSQEPGDEGGE
jgi:hypothetical protein